MKKFATEQVKQLLSDDYFFTTYVFSYIAKEALQTNRFQSNSQMLGLSKYMAQYNRLSRPQLKIVRSFLTTDEVLEEIVKLIDDEKIG